LDGSADRWLCHVGRWAYCGANGNQPRHSGHNKQQFALDSTATPKKSLALRPCGFSLPNALAQNWDKTSTPQMKNHSQLFMIGISFFDG